MNPTPVAWLHEEETSWWVTQERSYDEGETPLFTEAQLRQARADALREAADGYHHGNRDLVTTWLRNMAAELEKS